MKKLILMMLFCGGIAFGQTQPHWLQIAGRVHTDVRSFGAKGDGITDDTVAIQSAINSVNSAGGGTVEFPLGVYKVTTTIVVKPYVLLKGGDFRPERDRARQPTFNVYTGKNDINTPAFLMQLSSGIVGFAFWYPEQNAPTVTSDPIPFGWTIATDISSVPNLDNVYLENLMLINPYNGINLDRGGRFYINNIQGHPIHTGLYLDRILDVARAYNIHFWPFNASIGTPLYSWIAANGTALLIKRCDDVQVFSAFSFGYYRGIHLQTDTYGGPWITFHGACVDVSQNPIMIEGSNIITFNGGVFTNTSLAGHSIIAPSDIGGVVSFNGCYFYGGHSIGTRIISNNGTFNFSNCHYKRTGTNPVRAIDIISEGDAVVNITGGNVDPIKIFGNHNVKFNNINWPQVGADVTPVGIASATNWFATATTQISNGIELPVDTTTCLSTHFVLPVASMGNDLLVFEADFSLESPINTYMKLRVDRDNGIEVRRRFISSADFSASGTLKLRAPIWIGRSATPVVLRLQGKTYAAGSSNKIRLQNIKFYKADTSSLTSEQFVRIYELTRATDGLSATLTKPQAIIGGHKVIYGFSTTPTNGEWEVGDIIYYSDPATYTAAVCIASGTPGTWRSW